MNESGDHAAFSVQNSILFRSRNPVFSTRFPVLLRRTALAARPQIKLGTAEGSRGGSLEGARPGVLGFGRERLSTPSWVGPTQLHGAMFQETNSKHGLRAPSPWKEPS